MSVRVLKKLPQNSNNFKNNVIEAKKTIDSGKTEQSLEIKPYALIRGNCSDFSESIIITKNSKIWGKFYKKIIKSILNYHRTGVLGLLEFLKNLGVF